MTNRIREAIDILARAGWTKNSFTDEAGRHCLQGALYEAHGLRPFTDDHVGVPVGRELADDIRLVNEVVRAEFPERVGGVGASRFNDDPLTTGEEVVRIMEKAAVRRDELL